MDDDSPLVTGSVEFRHAVLLASEVFREISQKLRASTDSELKPLIDYLASGKELGPVERQDLIDLIGGELGRRPGRPTRTLSETWQRQRAHERYAEVMSEMKASGRPRPHADAAVSIVADETGYTQAQVRQILRDRKMRKIS